MSETKWTPGEYKRAGSTVYVLNEQGANRISARVEQGHVGKARSPFDLDTRTSLEEAEATAQIFTAAHELYEALEAMIEPFNGFSKQEVERRTDPPQFRRVMAARAALAKARGEG